MKLQRDHKVRKMNKKYLPRREQRMIRPVRNKKLSIRKRLRVWGKGSIVDYEINLRAMMAEFYCGTGAADIAKAISFLGLPGGKFWEKLVSKYMSTRYLRLEWSSKEELDGRDRGNNS